jgi:hypothetical protein
VRTATDKSDVETPRSMWQHRGTEPTSQRIVLVAFLKTQAFFSVAIKRPINAAVTSPGNSSEFRHAVSPYRIPIRFGGMRLRAVRAGKTPGNRRQDSNHFRHRTMAQ